MHLNLDDIAPPEEAPSKQADSNTAQELEYEEQLRHEELKRQRLENHGFSQDIAQRFTYANRVFYLIVGWLAGLGALILLQGYGGLGARWFHLSEGVMMTIVGGTTASILGIFAGVMNYLFHPKRVKPPSK